MKTTRLALAKEVRCLGSQSQGPPTNTMAFSVWGFMKQEVYPTPVNSEEDLLNRINAASVRVQEALTYKFNVIAIKNRSRAAFKRTEVIKKMK